MAESGTRQRKAARARRQSGAAQAASGFWERPQFINLIADLLLLFAFAALAYAAVFAATRLPFFPLRQVVVAQPLDRVTPEEIAAAAGISLTGNFFTVNLDAVRSALEKQPWIRKASIRRRWPDGIELDLEEYVAAARWQEPDDNGADMRLVDPHGEVFTVPATPTLARAPLLSGPEGSAPLLLARYREFRTLLSPLGRVLRAVVLSPRQAWQLRLDDGLTLELGRDQPQHPIDERIARFTATYGEVQARIKTAISVIDMRYPNGFALRLKNKGNT